MQQLVICHRVVSLNLEIVDPTKEDGVIVEQYYGGSNTHKEDGEIVEKFYRYSNPYKLERYSTLSEEVTVFERHPDPPSYIVAR